MKLVATAIFALVLHVLLGWAWTLGTGIFAGVWVGRRGWFVGGMGVGVSWLVLIVYNFFSASESVGRMTETLGGILGNLPGFAIVGITLLIGVVLGTVGGALGTQIRFAFFKPVIAS